MTLKRFVSIFISPRPFSSHSQSLLFPQLVEFTMISKKIPSTVAQRLILKFFGKKILAPKKVWHRLRETLGQVSFGVIYDVIKYYQYHCG